MSREDERSKSGSPIYRHQERDREFTAPEHADAEALEAHIERTIGPIETVLHELVSDLVHVDVYWVEAAASRPFHTLITGGMSALPMATPDDAEASPFAELVALLPTDWKLHQDDWKDERWYWPVRWLKRLARLPHEYETWLGYGHTIPNGDPPEPFAPNTGLTGMLLLPSISLPKASRRVVRAGLPEIELWTLYPLHTDEMDFKLASGTEALLERFDANAVSDVINPARPSVLGPPPRKKLFGLF